MEQPTKPQEIYKQQLSLYLNLLKDLKRKRSHIGWLRLILVLGILFLIYTLFFYSLAITWIGIAAATATFLYIVSVDVDNNEKIADAERMVSINEDELAIMAGNYLTRCDGESFFPPEHPYANDIDLFGGSSLYQYANRCTSQHSKKLFADGLLYPLAKDMIEDRQQAARNLAPFYKWRQKLQSIGLAKPVTFVTEEKLKAWIGMPQSARSSFWRYLPNFFTVIASATLGAYVFDLIPSSAFLLLVFTFFLIAKFTGERVIESCTALSEIEGEINTVHQQLQLVETIPSSSKLSDGCKALLITEKNGTAGIKELKKILKRFDYRLNLLVFFVLNTFFLWDVRQANSLNKWKDKYGLSVAKWFEVLATVEVVSTLATLTFNHPDWVFPVIIEDHFTFSGSNIGHPLIDAKKRVVNSFETEGAGKVSIITGSNMAGKSTFLRSIAVNVVLAQIGAPVCATAFRFSPAKLLTSMRIADNLAENTSTFYAELKKLKKIIDQVKKREKVFILLDEVLRGTNSLDRHTGSVALIRQLIRENAVAVIATHDIELARLEETYRQAISNYHFDVQVAGEELFFDYKLKPGICQSMNASLLMKKIGVEIEPDLHELQH